jgi:hypothetical protein
MQRHIFWLVCGLFVLFSFAPSVYELSRINRLPTNRQFELVHNFPTDYNFYGSRIRWGLEGKWGVQELYTTEPHQSSFIHEVYVLMGAVGKHVGVPVHRPGDIYHVGRLVLGFLLLVATGLFCRASFVGTTKPKHYISVFGSIAFFLAITASSWPKFVLVDGLPRFGGYMPWWSVMDSLQRITFIPHLLIGQVLMLVIMVGLWGSPVTQKRLIALGVLGFVLGLVFPPGLIFIYTASAMYALLEMLVTKKGIRKSINAYAPVFVGFIALSAPALVYLFVMTSVYPWKRLAELDILHPLPFNYGEYAQAVGPLLPLGLVGLGAALYKKQKEVFLAVAWVAGWLLLLFVFQFVPSQSPLRFSEMVPHVGLGVLTAYLCMVLAKRWRSASLIAVTALIMLGMLQMASSYMWQKDFVDHKVRASLPLVPTGSYVMYPLRDFMSAIFFIYNHTKVDEVILSETTAGNYIPPYASRRVYIGHDNTVAAEAKKPLVRKFFSGEMTQAEAKSFIQTTGATVIFFGPQEQEDGAIADLAKVYPFLASIYHTGFVTLYRVL